MINYYRVLLCFKPEPLTCLVIANESSLKTWLSEVTHMTDDVKIDFNYISLGNASLVDVNMVEIAGYSFIKTLLD